MRIAKVTAVPLDIGLLQPLKWGKSDELRQLDHVLFRVELSDGSIGIAEATPRPGIYGETQASILHIVAQHLAPLVVGQTVEGFESVAGLSATLGRIKNNNTAKGALDMALHSAFCRSRGVSLARYLGVSRHRIQLSYIVSADSPAAVLADVNTAYAHGIRVFKVKIGRNIADETETLRQLIADFADARFYVDANQTLANGSAADILNDLHAMGLLYCEEALPVHQLIARRDLRTHCAMPIIADDSAFTPADLERELAFDSFDILNIKTARTGFSASMAMLLAAAQSGKGSMIGSQASSLLGCMHAAVFAARAEVTCPSECSFFHKTDADLSHAPPIVAGWMRLADIESALDALHLHYA